MTSCTGSMENFNGDPRDEWLLLCFEMRGEWGEPEELLGESGGVLPAGNVEGNELLPEKFTVEEFPSPLIGTPALASAIKDFTYTHMTQMNYLFKTETTHSSQRL